MNSLNYFELCPLIVWDFIYKPIMSPAALSHEPLHPSTQLNEASVEESSSKHLSTIPQVPKSRKDNRRVTFVFLQIFNHLQP